MVYALNACALIEDMRSNSLLIKRVPAGVIYLLAFVILPILNASAAVWWVDKDAAGAGTGTSWADAFTTIQPAIDAAFADAGGEVWVAEGVYDESRTSPNADGGGVDTGSVVMKEGESKGRNATNLIGGAASWRCVRNET